MIENPLLIRSLRERLPESCWNWIIPALHHDPIIWESLQTDPFLEKVFIALSNPEDWIPANIGYLSLDARPPRIDAPPDVNLSAQAKEEFDAFIKSWREESAQYCPDLSRVTLIATGLFDNFNQSRAWKPVLTSLLNAPLGIRNIRITLQGTFTILLGILDDPIELLRVLGGPDAASSAVSLGIHACLSNPQPPGQLENQTKLLLAEIGLQASSRWLNKLSHYRKEESARLARWVLNRSFLGGFSNQIFFQDASLDKLNQDFALAELLFLAGRYEEADQFYSQAAHAHHSVADRVYSRRINCNLVKGGNETGIPVWKQIIKQPKAHLPHSLVVKALEKDIGAAFALVDEYGVMQQSAARLYLEAVQAAEDNKIPEARNLAFQALNSLEAELKVPEEADSKELEMVLTWLGNFLLSLSYPQAALRALQLAHELNPEDISILRILATAASLAGNHETAINAAQLAVAARPAKPEIRRELAMIYESAGNWEESLIEREKLTDRRFAPQAESDWPPASDWRELAACAVQAGDLQKAKSACFKALEMSPEDGLTQGILGKVFFALGENEQALNHLALATQQAPDRPQPWISLAKFYVDVGQKEKAIEILRSAANTVENDSSIHLSLAELYLADQSLTQAEDCLSRAYRFIDREEGSRVKPHFDTQNSNDLGDIKTRQDVRSRVAYLYGMTLYELGQVDKALSVLADIYAVHPHYPGLAYAYGRMLLEKNETRKAISPLAVAVAAGSCDPGPYLDYAFVLSRLKEQPDLAIHNLEKAISILDRSSGEGKTQSSSGILAQPTPAIAWIYEKPEWKYGFVTCSASPDATDDQIPEIAHGIGIALLAEVLEATGHPDSAIRLYSRALETTLAAENDWRIRLSLGISRVALQMGQPEIAIAALQDAIREEKENVEVYRILCEAYSAINLFEEALSAGRQAVQLAPDNLAILSWFIDKALDLSAIEEAIPMLELAIEIDPERIDLMVKLAGVYLAVGKKDKAHEILLKVLTNPHTAPDDLFNAASRLSSLGDEKNALLCLERALELQPDPPLQLLTDLTNAYHASSNDELALKTIEMAVSRHEDLPELHRIKADILTSLGRYQAAQASLEHALVLEPTNPEHYYKLARLLIDQGRLIEACSLTEKLVELINARQIDRFSLNALELAANTARSLLDLESARAILAKIDLASLPQEQLAGILVGEQEVDFFCLKAELALEADEEIAAAEAVNPVVSVGPSLPRVLALQARLSLRQSDSAAAQQFFSTALDSLILREVQQGKGYPFSDNSIVGVAQAAIDLGMWDKAVDLLTALAKNAKPNPYISVQIARALILKEEHIRLCKALNVVTHIPDPPNSTDSDLQAAGNALQSAKEGLPEELSDNPPTLLKRWKARYQALLQPGPDSVKLLQELPPNPSDQAALIFTLAQLDDLVSISQIFRSYNNQPGKTPIHHLVLAHFATAIGLKGRRQNDIDESIQAARAAIAQKPDQPLYYVILARLAHVNGDLKTAWDAMQTAIVFWPDEPRWLAFAAKIALAAGDVPAAIDQLDRAISLEPGNISHYLALGEAHLQIGNPNRAVNALEHALEIAPNRVEAYLALASAQLACGKQKDAAATAEKAINLAPDEVTPLLLAAEISLKAGEPDLSKRYAEAALKLKPDDPAANHLLARSLEQLGRPEESLKVIEKALPNASDPIPLLLARAKLIGYAHGDIAAFTELQELSNRYPDEPFILAELAKSLAKTGNQDQAIQTAQKALRSGNGHLSQEDRADLHHLLGTLLRKTGQLDQAVHQLSEAARETPQNLEIYLDLGELLQERRQYGKAIETLQKAITLAPNDPRPYYQIGVALRETHDYQAAEAMLRRAAELSPKDVAIHRQLAALIALNLVHSTR